MPKITEKALLNAGLKDVYEVNQSIFKKLAKDDPLFMEYQPAIFGKAELINYCKENLLPQAENEADETICSKAILEEASQLQANLDKFALSCPKAKTLCEHASQQLTAFLKANAGIF
jgi:hypothetical protein